MRIHPIAAPGEDAEGDAERGERGGLVPDGARDAGGRGAEDAQEADLPPSLEDEREERREDAEDGDGDRDRLEGVGHRERPVEEGEGRVAERGVRLDAQRETVPGRGEDAAAPLLGRDAGVEAQREARPRRPSGRGGGRGRGRS